MSYCELPSFYTYSEPVAKKVHRCCECSAPILVGEKHFHGRGKWDGRVDSYRQHLACMEACMIIRHMNDGECIGFGELKEEFGEIRVGWVPATDCEHWERLRHLMAVILIRERKNR